MSSRQTEKTMIFCGDFETTVYDNQTSTEVWASALVELYTPDVYVFHSIGKTIEFLKELRKNVIIYYHNLKFDGSFWLDYLLKNGWVNAYSESKLTKSEDEVPYIIWDKDYDMRSNGVKYLISDMGQWYSVRFKIGGYYVELRDSYKLLPFSVQNIGKSFNTEHQKLEMDYEGERYAGCYISPEERKYIENDVLVVKEALELFFDNGHNRMTIGSCCLSEYRNILKSKTAYDYNELFPDLTAIECPIDGFENCDEYIRKSYRGGWVYVVKGKENKVYHEGVTADVNSLYPSMMHSQSGNYYPVGVPTFWSGDIPKMAYNNNCYFFVRIECCFELKDGFLPTQQIKSNPHYNAREMLETSDVIDKFGKRFHYVIDKDGNKKECTVVLTLTQTDYALLHEHYRVNERVLDGCMFIAMSGIFDDYINEYARIKKTSKGAQRTLAKLFLNNLYGKMASSTRSDFKTAYIDENDTLAFKNHEANDKNAGFIAVGSAITSYARNFTIKAAQENYNGKGSGFIYADTDSIHCDLKPEEVKGITVHPNDFCCWKLEATWDFGLFVRPKTYIEHVIAEDLEPIDKPWYNVKCAGMSQKCKNLFISSVTGEEIEKKDELSEDCYKFLYDENGNIIHRDLTEFKRGLCIPGKLMPTRIPGGTLLVETNYEMR